MSITITDPALFAQFQAVKGVVDLRGPDGRVFATVRVPDPDLGQAPPGVTSPFTDEEMAERRKDRTRTGRKLADFLRELESQG